MIFAFHASDRGSNPSLAIIFIFCCCFLFAFVVFIFIYFLFFFIFNRINNPPTSAFRYKITEGSRYFVLCIEIQSFLVFTHHACITAIFDPTNEVFYVAKHAYRVYITFLIICFSNCQKLLHLSHTKTNC